MTDIYIDPLTEDIEVKSGRLSLTKDKAQSVQQKVKIALLTFQGEWFLDTTVGLPYFQTILRKPSNKLFIDALIQDYVRNLNGVSRITNFESNLDPRFRKYTVTNMRILIEDGLEVDVDLSV